MEKLDPATIVYVDETGFDSVLYRRFARAKRGVKVMANISGKRYARTSIIAGLHNNAIIAPMVFKGYCDTHVVTTWVEKVLLPAIPRGSVIIWDNASFHKSEALQTLIEEAGCRLLFLPAYSPDLNPIEGWWAVLKRVVTNGIRLGLAFFEAIQHFFKKESKII
ncbi:MAG: IS630 family transposase [Dolichospermum sp.]